MTDKLKPRSVLGSGGFGTVYRSQDDGQECAIKRIPLRGNLSRMMLEPYILEVLDHPHIVKCRGYRVESSELVIMMDYVEGQSIREMLEEKYMFSYEEIWTMLSQLGSALEHAHALSITHRDIKPENIMRTTVGGETVYILVDFGVSELSKGLATNARLAGTYCYMAPEQLRGRPTFASDMWGLGAVAFEMMTGNQLFCGTRNEIYRQIQFGRTDLPANSDPSYLDLVEIIDCLLNRDVQCRMSSSELVKQLRTASPNPTNWNNKLSDIADFVKLVKHPFTVYALVGCMLIAVQAPGLRAFDTLKDLSLAAHVHGVIYIEVGEGRRKSLGWLMSIAGAFGMVLSFIFLCIFCDAPEDAFDLSEQLFGIKWIFVTVLAVLARRYVKERLTKRLFMLRARDGAQPKFYRDVLDELPEDMGLRRMYSESLFAAGEYEEAAIQAMVILHRDQMNIDSALMLGNCYLEMGMWDACVQICERWLSHCGYIFEFKDLRDEALLRSGFEVKL